jgi:hypothetical protein
MYSLLILKII